MSRNYSVKLRPGIARANLPDKRKMVSGTTYVIPERHFAQISPKALQNVIQVTGVTEGLAAQKAGVDLTTNSVTIPTGFKVGQVELGLGEHDKFMLVKVVDAVNVTAGMVLCWANRATRTVTPDRVGGSALTPLTFAGIAPSAITAGRYGWMQVDGTAPAPASIGTAGDTIEVHPTVDGTARVATTNEVYTLATSGTGGTVGITYNGVTQTVAYNANAATVQTAMNTLVGAGNSVVTGTDLTGAGLTITLQGIYTGINVVDLSRVNGVTGGAGTSTLTKTQDGASRAAVGISLGTIGVNIRGYRRHPHRDILRRNVK